MPEKWGGVRNHSGHTWGVTVFQADPEGIGLKTEPLAAYAFIEVLLLPVKSGTSVFIHADRLMLWGPVHQMMTRFRIS